tara:strand:- start:9561 stop:10847 length:1287 start_codon:yes stop_codon:yes gene_type:complete
MAIETLKNNSTLEITGSNNITISSATLNSGETNQKKQFSFSGRVQLNKPTVIGTLKLTAAENKRFLKAPGLKNKPSSRSVNLGSNLRMKLKSTEKDANNNVTIYLYDLIYTAKESVSKVNKLKYLLSNKTRAIISKLTGIDRVECGKISVNSGGETRRITIYGTPNTDFKIALNKITDSKDTNKDIISSIEESILDSSLANSTTNNSSIVDFTGLSVPSDAMLTGKLNSKGIYSFVQSFPSITKADFFDSTTPYLGRYSLNINSTFKSRLKGWTKDRQAFDYSWSGWYTKILRQSHRSTLKIAGTINNVLYTVNDQVIPGGASAQTITHEYIPGRGDGNFVVTYVLKPVSAAHAFASTGRAVTTSDWSNSNPDSNGGTDVILDNFSLVLSTRKIANDTATFKFSIKVHDLGINDLTIAMAINQLVTCS